MNLISSSTNEDNVFRVHISPLDNDIKPSGRRIEDIVNTMTTSDNYSLEIEIEALQNGHTIIPVQLSNYDTKPLHPVKNDYFKAQQQFFLDVDSKPAEGLIAPPIYEVLEKLQGLCISPVFAYPTFSHTDKHPKYRISLIHDRKVYTDFERQVILNCFAELIGKQGRKYFTDKSTFNPARLFFGTDKKVILIDPTARFEINGLIDITTKFLHDKGAKVGQGARVLKEFASRVGLSYDKDKGLYLPENTNDGKCINIYNTNSVVTENYQYGIMKISFDKLLDTCKLARMLNEGQDLLHHDRVRLMSNMLYIRGGEKAFVQLIYSKHYRQYKIGKTPDYEVSNWKQNKGSAVGCKDCTYFEECNPSGNNILNSIVRLKGAKFRLIEKVQTVSVEHVRGTQDTLGSLEYHLQECIEPDKVNIIRADCGVGKTRYIQQHDNVIIATPTNDVCLQIVHDRRTLGLDTIYFPDLKEYWTERIKSLYKVGAVNEANIEIRKLAKEYKDIPEHLRTDKQQAYIDYVNAYKRLKDEDTTAVITIDRLLNLRDSMERTVFFDENPLYKITVNETLEYETITKLRQQFMEFPVAAVKKIIEGLESKQEAFDISKEERKELANYVNELSAYNARIFKLINADKVKYISTGVVCYRERKFPTGTITILSGTLYPEFAEQVLKREINYMDLGIIELKGEIIMQTKNSYSRKQVMKNIEEYKNIIRKHKECNFIVHQTFEILLEEEGISKERYMHFGNTHGKNNFIGKDLCVIGTPYVHPDMVRNFAWGIGHNCPEKITPRYQKVQFAGYEFYETTFDDKVLRTIHLQMMHEELIQAVYRARPIDNACKVYVYSALPIMGAKFVS